MSVSDGKHGSGSEVIIVGGGVIGLAVAWRAAQHGLHVTVLERDQFGGGASHVAAGMLAPISEADSRELSLLRLGLLAAEAYPDFVAELEASCGLDTGYVRSGTLLVARDADEAQALAREHKMRQRLGLPAHRLPGSEARALEPGLAPAVRLALEFPGDHAVDPRRLTAALASAARRAGALLRPGAQVIEISVCNERVSGVRLSGGERLGCAQVVLCAGGWSAGIAGLSPRAQVPVRPVKGQILRLHDPAGPGLLTRVLRMLTGYIVPRADGRYVLGATVEERGFDTSVTAGAVFELLRDATELLPGLSELVIDELSAGLRPGTPDNAPLIGPGEIGGLYWATGHYRNGVLLAPLTAEIVTAMLLGAEPALPVAEFAPGRFAVGHGPFAAPPERRAASDRPSQLPVGA